MPVITKALTLKDLPPPPPDKFGWPWTEQTEPLPERMPDGSEYLRISIVTPSYNQGQFIEETIRSVLLQGYPSLEYIIIDGGSTDNTLEVIQKYEHYLAHWVSESDRGQAHALNKGFQRATGELIGWQNSDDYYFSHAFIQTVGTATQSKEFDVFYGSRDYLNLDKVLIPDEDMSEFNLDKMISNGNMANQSMFFRSKIFGEKNFLDESFHHCMDHEFYWRLISKGYNFLFIPGVKGCYRLHIDCKGCSPNNTYLSDTTRIYAWIYKNKTFSINVRRQAWALLRAICLNSYGKSKLRDFRRMVHQLINLRGLTALDTELSTKYIVSLGGERNLELLRKMKKAHPTFVD